MKIEHVALWTNRLEILKDFYVRYFGGKANTKYHNASRGFQSYFLTFDSGARLEIMHQPGLANQRYDPEGKQHLGLIHLAYGVDTMVEVDDKAAELTNDGYKILSGPRKTGDGYYEFEVLDPDNNRIEVTTLYRE